MSLVGFPAESVLRCDISLGITYSYLTGVSYLFLCGAAGSICSLLEGLCVWSGGVPTVDIGWR